MSNQLTVIDGYAEREAINDNNVENLNISYICGNVVDFFVNFQEKETINSFDKILKKEIILD